MGQFGIPSSRGRLTCIRIQMDFENSDNESPRFERLGPAQISKHSAEVGSPRAKGSVRPLSEVDKKILKVLLQPDGKSSSVHLEKKLGIPRTTVQRRRRYLEQEYLEFRYVLKLSSLGFRRVDLFIYTGGGGTGSVAKELMKHDEVVYVGSSVGEHTIDLRAEIIIRDNSELLDVLERVKAMPGVRDVVWSEIVQVLGRKLSIPPAIIDKL
jgi:DNA-binding Lrp family transcriptional regulator